MQGILKKRRLVLIGAVLVVAACAGPRKTDPVSMNFERFDDQTTFVVEPSPEGFDVLVRYGRYQFAPNRPLVADECRTKVIEVSKFHAQRSGMDIQPLSPLRIRVSTDRNIISAETFCEATATVLRK